MELRTIIMLTMFVLISAPGVNQSNAQELTQEERRERLAKAIEIDLKIPSRIYEGLPCIAQVSATCVAPAPDYSTIKTDDDYLKLTQAERDKLAFEHSLATRLFPRFDPFTTHPLPVSIRVEDDGGNEVIAHSQVSEAAIFFDRHIGADPERPHKHRPRVSVSSGEKNTWLFDLALKLSELKSGKYSISIRLHDFPDSWWESPKHEFEIVVLDQATWKLIETGIPQVTGNRRPQQRDWLDDQADIAFLSTALPPDVWAQLAFYILLGHGAEIDKTGTLSPEVFKALPSPLKSMREVVQYELMLHIGDEGAALRSRERISAERPDLLWLIEQADQGKGLVQQARDALASDAANGEQK